MGLGWHSTCTSDVCHCHASSGGPTPEFPDGWRGNAPVDAVDAACRDHDAAYDSCADGLFERHGPGIPSRGALSVLTALRSTGFTAPILAAEGVDEEYSRCTHAADQGLIRDGLRIRGASQRSSCTENEFATPSWFCDLRSLTLHRIEQVDFDLFLSDLDWDEDRAKAVHADVGGAPAYSPARQPALRELEAERRRRMQMSRSGGVSEAAAAVFPIEEQMVARLTPPRH